MIIPWQTVLLCARKGGNKYKKNLYVGCDEEFFNLDGDGFRVIMF